jgi:hypothetical protein
MTKTKKQTEFKFKKFIVTAKLEETGVKFPNTDEKDQMLHNHFIVTVKNENGSIDFDWYGSYNDHKNNVTELDKSNLKDALHSFFSDTIAGNMDFKEFCSEFGYDEDSRKAEKIYNACGDLFEKTEILGITTHDLYDYVNKLND